MVDDLRGVEIRLERAHEHVDALRHEALLFMMESSQPFGSEIDADPTDGEYIVRARIFRNPPVHMSLLASDAAHAVRSALDMIAWRLARLPPNEAPDDDRTTAFPICGTSSAWESRPTESMLKYISPAAREVIESWQPFRNPGRETARLEVIQAIDNWSKHHDIPVLLGFRLSEMRVITPGYSVRSVEERVFQEGDEICRVTYEGDGPLPRFQSLMTCHVAFAPGPPALGYPIDFLENTVDMLRGRLLPEFEPFFI